MTLTVKENGSVDRRYSYMIRMAMDVSPRDRIRNEELYWETPKSDTQNQSKETVY